MKTESTVNRFGENFLREQDLWASLRSAFFRADRSTAAKYSMAQGGRVKPLAGNIMPFSELLNPSLPMHTDLCWSGAESRAFDAFAQEVLGIPSAQLMENAGQASARLALRLIESESSLADAPILCLIGPGNNGGDGLVVARALHMAGSHQVVAWAPLGLPAAATSAAGMARRAVEALGLRIDLSANGPTLPHRPALAVDALFGVGLQRELSGIAAQAIQRLCRLTCPVLALDLPSGIDADTGEIWGIAPQCRATVSFIGVKQGLRKDPARAIAGEVWVGEIGLAQAYCQAWLRNLRGKSA
jgi:hydroxyethylthiazole kinase-like uncharacterized protein yjeF